MEKNTLKGLQVIHKAMLIGQIIFAAIAVFLQYNSYFISPLTHLDQLLQVIAVVLSLAGFYIGKTIFEKRVQQARDNNLSLTDKAVIYRQACTIQWALLEAAALFCIICFLLVGNYAFTALAAALVLWFALTAPSKMKAMLLLRLSEAEMEAF